MRNPRPGAVQDTVVSAILFFEAVAIIRLVRDTADSAADFSIVLITGLIAASVPYGYLVALIAGTILAYLVGRRRITLAGVTMRQGLRPARRVPQAVDDSCLG